MAPNGLMGGIMAYGTDQRGRQYYAHFFDGGGMGAGARSDGNPTLIFPSSASNGLVSSESAARNYGQSDTELLSE